MRNAFYTNALTLLHSPTPLTFSLLYNKDIIINLYKLYFPSSHFSLQPSKKVLHPPIFPPLQPNTYEGKPNLFYPPTNFPSSHFSTPPNKRTLRVVLVSIGAMMSELHKIWRDEGKRHSDQDSRTLRVAVI